MLPGSSHPGLRHYARCIGYYCFTIGSKKLLTSIVEWVIIDTRLASCESPAPLGFSHHERTTYREDGKAVAGGPLSAARGQLSVLSKAPFVRGWAGGH